MVLGDQLFDVGDIQNPGGRETLDRGAGKFRQHDRLAAASRGHDQGIAFASLKPRIKRVYCLLLIISERYHSIPANNA